MTAALVERDRKGHRAIPLGVRSRVILILISIASLMAFAWPLLLKVSPDDVAQQTQAPVILIVLLPLLIVVMLAELTSGGWDIKALAMLAVLGGIGAVLRPMGAGIGGIEIVFFLIVLAGRVFGPGFGFVLGNTTIFASAILTGGVGPWLPFQMIAAGWVGLGAGLLPQVRGKTEVIMLMIYGALAGLAFGILMNLWFWPFTLGAETQLSYVAGAPVLENLQRLIVFSLATSLAWDVGRAITTAVLIGITGTAVLATLRRAATKASFDAPVTFIPEAKSADLPEPLSKAADPTELDCESNSISRPRESRLDSGADPQP